MKNAALDFENLTAGYHGTGKTHRGDSRILLKHLTGSLSRGRLILLLGENGSGKSTLLKTLAGLISPLAGTVWLDGTPLTQLSHPRQARLRAFVSGGWTDPGPMTLAEFVSLGRIPWGPKDTGHEIVLRALSAAELEGRGGERVSHISDGERQKAKIARALCQETPLLILDEPDSHLDIRAREELLALLVRCVRTEGKTVLFSSHDLTAGLQSADGCWLIHDRRLLSFEKEALTPERAREYFKGGFSGSPSLQPL